MTKYLSPGQIERWSEDGFLKVSGFLSEAETARLRGWVADIEGADAQSTGIMHHFEKTAEGIRPSRTENFLPYHRGLEDLLTRGKILSLVSELMGETAVVYKEKINYKYPGGGGYIAHQDAPAYEFISFHVTCLIAVDAATDRERLPLLLSGPSPPGTDRAGRPGLYRTAGRGTDEVGPGGKAPRRRPVLQFLRPAQERSQPFGQTAENHLRDLQCAFLRRFSRTVLRRQAQNLRSIMPGEGL